MPKWQWGEVQIVSYPSGATKSAESAMTLAEMHLDYSSILQSKSKSKGRLNIKATATPKTGDFNNIMVDTADLQLKQREHMQVLGISSLLYTTVSLSGTILTSQDS